MVFICFFSLVSIVDILIKAKKKYLTDVAVFFYRRKQFNSISYRQQGIALTITG